MDIKTTWGTITVELDNGKAVSCTLPYMLETPETPFAIKGRGKDSVSRFIRAIFTGQKAQVPAIVKPEGTDFQKSVWRAISNIPPGQTQTYGELAEAIQRPRAVRAVGTACGKNPISLLIPCHRVVASNGGLGGFSSGLAWKKLLLQIERGE